MRNLGVRFGLGLLIVLVGVLLLVQLFAGVHLPIFGLVVGIAILLIGARMIATAWNLRRDPTIAGEAVLANLDFSQTGTIAHDERFDVVFGRSTIDLTQLAEPDHDVTVTVDTLFGRTIVKVPPHIAYDVEGSAALGQVRMPDRSSAAMGTVEYRAPNGHPTRLHLRLHAVLGACHVVEVE